MSDNKCSDCCKEFTDAQCEDGALIEIDDWTYKTEDGVFIEIHGYRMQCEECYDLPTED